MGATLILFLNIIDLEYAIESIDFYTISLLIGMMIIVNILKKTGFFQYIAIKAAKTANGDPWKPLSVITAISSALLDNVTTVLIIAPVTLVMTEALKINPIPFMVSQILAANIGGTATLIGNPPNIMIGSETTLGFLDFLFNLFPIVLFIFIIIFFIIRRIYKPILNVYENQKIKMMELDESLVLTDKKLLIQSLFILILTILGFILHQFIDLESAAVALGGVAILLIISKSDPEEIFQEIE